MRYKAEVHGTVKGTDLTYVLVRYFASDGDTVPTLVEDHLMQLADVGMRIVTDANGFLGLTDGSFVDPAKIDRETQSKLDFLREDYKEDVFAVMEAAFLQRWAVAVEKKHSGDWTGDAAKPALVDGKPQPQGHQKIALDQSDPKGVLSRPDVIAIRVPDSGAGIKGGKA